MEKKELFYELDIKSFYDKNNDGIGDLKGFISKIDYFKDLGVGNIIFNDILNINNGQENQSFLEITNNIGTKEDFEKAINLLKTKGIKTFIELEIGNIREEHKWFKKATSNKEEKFKQIINFKSEDENIENNNINTILKYSNDNKQFYIVNQNTQEVPLNWLCDEVIEQFIKVVKFWNDLGVDGFIILGFEYLSDENKQEILSFETSKQLRKFYKNIKSVNEEIKVIGKSNILSFEQANELIQNETLTFDYFIADLFYKNGLSKKYGSDKIGKFSIKKLYKDLKKWTKNSRQIISFGSKLTGRFNERWNGNESYKFYSAKAFAMLQIFNPASTLIHYADELGVFNIGLTHFDDFFDNTLEKRKRELGNEGLNSNEFMKAQVLQNPINSKSLMPWNSKKNGGFSLADKTFILPNKNFKEINVVDQYMDKNSVFNLYKNLIKKINNLSEKQYKEFQSSFKISNGFFVINRNILKISFKISGEKYNLFTNLYSNKKKVFLNVLNNAIISNYFNQDYFDTLREMKPFESILFTTTDINIIESNKKEEKDINSIKNIKEKAKIDLDEKLKLKEEEVWKKLEKEEKTKLKEDELAYTTLISDNEKI